MVAVPKPALVQVPASAGVGLRFRPRFPDPTWPEDWWQRNYDTLCEDIDPDPWIYCDRHMQIPPAPVSRSKAGVPDGNVTTSATTPMARTEPAIAPLELP